MAVYMDSILLPRVSIVFALLLICACGEQPADTEENVVDVERVILGEEVSVSGGLVKGLLDAGVGNKDRLKQYHGIP